MSPRQTALNVLWSSYGCPEPPGSRATLVSNPATCSLCGSSCEGRAYAVSDVVSDNSTIWDTLRQTTHGGTTILCGACGWAFRADSARKMVSSLFRGQPHRVAFRDLALTFQKPILHDDAYAVPITGRKHVLPYLAWGHVATDAHLRLAWGQEEAQLARAVYGLRMSGVAWTDIQSAQPGSSTRSVSASNLNDWSVLREWKDTLQLAFITAVMRKAGVKAQVSTDA